MTDFSPDQVTFGDKPGYGMWDDGHAREHLTFVTTFALQTPAVLMPAYDLLLFLNAGPARKSVLERHYSMHQLIRLQLGFSGIDLSAVDLDQEQDFYSWTQYHADEHRSIRQALGLT